MSACEDYLLHTVHVCRRHRAQNDEPPPVTPELRLVSALILRTYADLALCPPDTWAARMSKRKYTTWELSYGCPVTVARLARTWIELRSPEPWGYAWACELTNTPMLTVEQVLKLDLRYSGR